MRRVWGGLVRLVTGEWILQTFAPGENSGGVILARALWSGFVGYAVLLVVHELVDPQVGTAISWRGLRETALDKFAWLGAIFGGTYATLHTRFSSQWSYLANLYNQIKAAEVALRNERPPIALVRWKVGFIEDALALHLSMKPIFASVIAYWGQDQDVVTEIKSYGVKGKCRLLAVIEDAKRCFESHYGSTPIVPPTDA